jgi:hypothetical protein
MELTKRKALEICRDLWLWLADNPDQEKGEWPDWEEHGDMDNFCPCCEYFLLTNSDNDACDEECLLKDLWPYGCVDCDSAFQKWRYSEVEDRKEPALEIAQACEKELEKLPDEHQETENNKGQVNDSIKTDAIA